MVRCDQHNIGLRAHAKISVGKVSALCVWWKVSVARERDTGRSSGDAPHARSSRGERFIPAHRRTHQLLRRLGIRANSTVLSSTTPTVRRPARYPSHGERVFSRAPLPRLASPRLAPASPARRAEPSRGRGPRTAHCNTSLLSARRGRIARRDLKRVPALNVRPTGRSLHMYTRDSRA